MAIDTNNIVPSAVPKTPGLPVVKIGEHYFPVGVVSGGSGNADVEYGVINGEGNFQPLDVSEVPPLDDGDAVDAEIVMYDNGDYPDPVDNGQGKYRVRFFDYDGTILKTVYTDGGAVTAPAVPDHERLLFQEWNNDFDDITADLDVGAIYTTKSGKCEFDIDINSLAGLTAYMGINLESGTVTVEWGDGQSETLSTAGDTRLSHIYASAGKYMISVSGTDSWMFGTNPLSSAADQVNSYVMNIRIANTPPCSDWINSQYGGNTACRTMTFDNKSFAGIVNNQPLASAQSLVHFNHPTTLARNGMFRDAISLKHIVLKSTMTALENYFLYSSGLEDIVLPRDLVTVNSGSFGDGSGHLKIAEMTIPAKVTDMTGCLGVGNYRRGFVRILKMRPTTPPQIGSTITDTYGTLKEIIVPAGCGEAYKSATNWSTFADIIKEEE